VRTGWHRVYAIGAHGAVVRALRATFTDHGMRIQQEKGTTLVHFPGGWLDRAASAYNRSMSVMGGPLANSFTLAYTRTDNAAVTLVDVQLYHKTSFISNRLTESRIGKFFSALQQEAAIAISRLSLLTIGRRSSAITRNYAVLLIGRPRPKFRRD